MDSIHWKSKHKHPQFLQRNKLQNKSMNPILKFSIEEWDYNNYQNNAMNFFPLPARIPTAAVSLKYFAFTAPIRNPTVMKERAIISIKIILFNILMDENKNQ